MKTIKELEAEIEKVSWASEKFVRQQIQTLKDVLGLIDEMEIYAGYPQPNTAMINKEELKARITG